MRPTLLGVGIVALASVVVAAVLTLPRILGRSESQGSAGSSDSGELVIPPAVDACARCHARPPADVLPSERWPNLLDHMAALITQYKLGVPLTTGELNEIRDHFVSNAPSALPVLVKHYEPTQLRFERTEFGIPYDPNRRGGLPIIGNINVVDLDGNNQPDVLVCDVANHAVTWVRQVDGQWQEARLATVRAPAHTEVADVNGDGRLDIAVASLGTITPTEDPVGSVVLLLGQEGFRFQPTTLIQNVPRVPNVQPVDLDGDGDLDLLAALYGMFKSGGICWLEQTADGEFVRHDIYKQNGCSHVPTVDLDGDGRADFVAFFSQEHEEVLAFRNLGEGRFESTLLFRAKHPIYGSATMELTDLDQDGDWDALLSNGDALDQDPKPKPYHGLQWIENQGGFKFVAHHLIYLYGAYAADAGDLDGDGDLDIVLVSIMNKWYEPGRQSIIWLENDGAQSFTPHALDDTPTQLVCVAIHDLNGDQRADVLAGAMNIMEPYVRVGRMALWTNLGSEPSR